MMRTTALIVILLGLLVAACSSDETPPAPPSMATRADTSAITTTTAPVTTTTRQAAAPPEQHVFRLEQPVLVVNDDGVVQINRDEQVTQLVPGPVAYAVDDTRGSLLLQFKRGRQYFADTGVRPPPGASTIIWWIPAGSAVVRAHRAFSNSGTSQGIRSKCCPTLSPRGEVRSL